MPFFSHGEAKYKLILLYIINHCQTTPTRDQLYRTAILNSSMEYFAFEQALHELEEDRMIVSIQESYSECFGLTDSGREALSMFEKSVPADERLKLDNYLEDNRDVFAHEREITSRISGNQDGSTLLEMMINERGDPIFSISVSVSSKEQAMEMRSHWESKSETIYNFVWDSLLNKQPK